MKSEPVITLLTDFGAADGYVAAMKGVMATLAEGVRLVDAAHDIPAHDVRAGAWALMKYWSLFPPGTIHVAVVDPGVGSSRRGLLVEADGRWLTGPDNGLLGWPMREASACRVRALRPEVHLPGPPSNTFHGRDIFAYVAGRLAAGAAPSDLGDEVHDAVRPRWLEPAVAASRIEGEVVHVDRFGNLETNIRAALMEGRRPAEWRILAGSTVIGTLHRTYAEVAPGSSLALIGSSGFLEIAVREASAEDRLGLSRGDPVILEAISI